jgi:hypothetical protein
VASAPDSPPIRIAAAGCITAFGNAAKTHQALLAGQRALQLHPVLGADGGDAVPLALLPSRTLDETAPPNWLQHVSQFAKRSIPEAPWGSARFPVFVTSSNFGVGSLYAFQRTRSPEHLAFGTPFSSVEAIRRELNWGANVAILSHACVSAHLGLLLASRSLHARLAERALVFSFDFVSPFVAGGFHALKILNGGFPAPYAARETGSIGLGDGVAFAVLERSGPGSGDFQLEAQSLHNEMHHFTANRADGSGFATCVTPVASGLRGRRAWIKGHGTGTLEAGRLEAETLARLVPDAPLVSWKGSLGHTLGSCGLVELAVAMEAVRHQRVPATIGSAPPHFTAAVATEPFGGGGYDAVLLTSNAFGGAHAACLLTHA